MKLIYTVTLSGKHWLTLAFALLWALYCGQGWFPRVKAESYPFSHTARRWNGQDLNSSLLDGISYPYESRPVVPTVLWIRGAVILVPSSQLTQLWTRGMWATAKGCLSDQRRCRAVVSCRSFRASVKNLYLRSAMKPYDLWAKDNDDDSLPLLSSFCIPSIFVEHTVCITWFKLGENPPVIGVESHTSVIIQLSVTSILGLKIISDIVPGSVYGWKCSFVAIEVELCKTYWVTFL